MRRKIKNDRYDIYEGDFVNYIDPAFGRVYRAKVLAIKEHCVRIMVIDWDEGQEQGEVINRLTGGKIHHFNEIRYVRHEDLELDAMTIIKRIMK